MNLDADGFDVETGCPVCGICVQPILTPDEAGLVADASLVGSDFAHITCLERLNAQVIDRAEARAARMMQR